MYTELFTALVRRTIHLGLLSAISAGSNRSSLQWKTETLLKANDGTGPCGKSKTSSARCRGAQITAFLTKMQPVLCMRKQIGWMEFFTLSEAH